MPINILLTFILGSLLGWAVIQITRAPSGLRSLIFGCCSAGKYLHLILQLCSCDYIHSSSSLVYFSKCLNYCQSTNTFSR